MKIEEGKFYRARDGRKAGPMISIPSGMYHFRGKLDGIGPERTWLEDGQWVSGRPSGFDLVAPWEDTPAPPDPRDAEIARLREALKQALDVVDKHSGRVLPVLVALETIADIEDTLSRDGGSDE